MSALIQFTVGNFRSFRERVTLSLLAETKLVSRDRELDAQNVFEVDDEISLVRTAAIYGANASGKSNLLSAIRFMRSFVLNSSKETAAAQPIPAEPFLLSESRDQATFVEVVFVLRGATYRYGFEVDREAVRTEWLFQRTGARESKLFTREGSSITIARTGFKEGRGLEERTRANALFLSVVAQFNGQLSVQLQRWFTNSLKIISGLNDVGHRTFTVNQCEQDDTRSRILEFVRRMDVGIEDLAISKVPLGDKLPPNMPAPLKQFLVENADEKVATISTIHQRFDAQGASVGQEVFDIEQHESEGTKKVFALSGPIVDSLAHGRLLVVDELDARLHPLITIALIRLFNSRETNPHNAQLVFTTHDTNLLNGDHLRRDQIWFVEKDRYGASHLYSLLEYKPRNDTSLAKNYIHGRYGGIPFVGDMSGLIPQDAEDASPV